MSKEHWQQSGFEFLQYRLDTLLGEGGMGVVYRAEDTRLQVTEYVDGGTLKDWFHSAAQRRPGR